MNISNFNFFGYRIFSNTSLKNIEAATAAFRYKGYEVSFTTFQPGGSKVCVFRDEALIGEYGTVEAACAAVDEISAWQRAPISTHSRVARHVPHH